MKNVDALVESLLAENTSMDPAVSKIIIHYSPHETFSYEAPTTVIMPLLRLLRDGERSASDRSYVEDLLGKPTGSGPEVDTQDGDFLADLEADTWRDWTGEGGKISAVRG